MKTILQKAIPEEMLGNASLPGVAPCAPDDWLRIDDAYAAQMAYRLELLERYGSSVLWSDPAALPATQEVLEEAMKILPQMDFVVSHDQVICPDGRQVLVDWNNPLYTLGALVQQDICVMEKRGDEHVLVAAVLCFPANWRLAEKAGRPLTTIHKRIEPYDENIARRVQRLFDGVQVGRPLWRYNRLTYVEPDLHQPHRKNAKGKAGYVRSERQTILRLPQTGSVVFAIHTFVVPLTVGVAAEAATP